jgi:hypothetical protein
MAEDRRQRAEDRGQKAEGSKNIGLRIRPCAKNTGKGLFALTLLRGISTQKQGGIWENRRFCWLGQG